MDEPELQPHKKEEGLGPIAGAVIIVLLVAIAGIYFLLQEQKRLHAPPVEQTFNA